MTSTPPRRDLYAMEEITERRLPPKKDFTRRDFLDLGFGVGGLALAWSLWKGWGRDYLNRKFAEDYQGSLVVDGEGLNAEYRDDRFKFDIVKVPEYNPVKGYATLDGMLLKVHKKQNPNVLLESNKLIKLEQLFEVVNRIPNISNFRPGTNMPFQYTVPKSTMIREGEVYYFPYYVPK